MQPYNIISTLYFNAHFIGSNNIIVIVINLIVYIINIVDVQPLRFVSILILSIYLTQMQVFALFHTDVVTLLTAKASLESIQQATVSPHICIYHHFQDRLWRKTRSKNETTPCVGVDANRNFDYKWLSEYGDKLVYLIFVSSVNCSSWNARVIRTISNGWLDG